MQHVWCALMMLCLSSKLGSEIQGLDHLPVRSEVENIPPSATNLLAQERLEHEDKSIKKIQALVAKALAKQNKKKNNKKRKKTKEKKAKPAKKSKKIGAAPATSSSSTISSYQYRILEEQFASPELQVKNITCKFKDTSIRDAILLVSKLAGIECVVDGDVDGRVKNLEIKDNDFEQSKLYFNQCLEDIESNKTKLFTQDAYQKEMNDFMKKLEQKYDNNQR